MSRTKLKKFKFIKDFCISTGIIGFLIVSTIPDDMPMDLFFIRMIVGSILFILSFFTHKFVSGYERYVANNSTRK